MLQTPIFYLNLTVSGCALGRVALFRCIVDLFIFGLDDGLVSLYFSFMNDESLFVLGY